MQANNLKNSVPAKELQFLENYNATKQQLRTIFDQFNTYECTSDSNSVSTVERLKQVATIGFEASQTQSIITAFANENEFTCNEETRNLIKRLHRQYPFLKMFNGPALQASIAVDLIISLTNSYEMCFNIFNMLTKLWVDQNWLNDDGISFGYLKFIKNISECLQLYKSHGNNNFGVRDLICNECYVLSPLELKVKLEKEKVMKSIECLTSNDIDSLDKWKAMLKPFESIRSDVNYFNRCYNFIVNLIKLLNIRHKTNINLTPMDAMENDLTAVIGEIVFVQEKLPSDVVEIVENLNINFVYVLCVNMMPMIHCVEPDDSAVTASLIENLRNDNLLNSKPDKKILFPLNQEVFNFIKKNNYLVAYLQQEYSRIENPTIVYEQRYLQNVMALDDVKTVAMIHGDNLLLSALSYDTFDVCNLEKYLNNNTNYR